MWPVSEQFLRALRSSHTQTLRAEAWQAGAKVCDLAVVGGSIRATSRSAVRRSLTMDVADEPGAPVMRDLLDVFTTEIRVWAGVQFARDQVEEVPVGIFRLDSVDEGLAELGSLSLSGPDRMARIVDDRFLYPRQPTAVATQTMIETLITESVPGAVVNKAHVGSDPVLSPSWALWEEDRFAAVDDLALSLGAEAWARPDGTFEIGDVATAGRDSAWRVDVGTTGVIVGGSRTWDREGVYNSVKAFSAPTDGTAPFYAVVEDTNPASKTYVSGPFGRVPRFYSSPLLRSTAQCQAAATAILGRSLGRRGELALSVIPNPALEIGDVVDVYLSDGALSRRVVEGFTLPLTPGAPMTLSLSVAA